MGIRHRETLLENTLNPLLATGWIAWTIPEKLQSAGKGCAITEAGRSYAAAAPQQRPGRLPDLAAIQTLRLWLSLRARSMGPSVACCKPTP